MADYNNSGILFRNNRKTQPRHPDYQGNATVDGKRFNLAAWLKDGKKGKFMSIAFKPADEQRQAPAAEAPAEAQPEQPEEGQIPF